MPIEESVEPAEVAAPEKKSSRKLVLFGVAGLVSALLVGGGTYWYLQQGKGGEHDTAPAAEAASTSYVEVPPMVVNLRSGGGEARFLKLRFIVVAAGETQASEVKDKLPVLLDTLQPFLRELRPSDLDGSAAVFRIKEEMLRRARLALGQGVVTDVLIQDLVQQ